MPKSDTARLLISASDQPGLVAAVSQFLHSHGANVLDAAQHATAPQGGAFFMRVVFTIPGLADSVDHLERAFGKRVGEPFAMDWKLHYTAPRKRMAILVSKYDHALVELLWRWRSSELDVDIPLVVSNHDDLRSTVEHYDIPFHHLPISKTTKPAQEQELIRLLDDHAVDFLVLARYMQILTPRVVEPYRHRIINIHHSFLPAFVGANPYRHAYNRGVKLIGATAHYVTADLDEGPIIEQDVRRVSHRHEVNDLRQLGREVERNVLARAVAAHATDRVLVYGNKTVVFEA